MTYQEFKNKYNNHYVDFDNYFGPQCFDLAQFYFTQVLEVPSSVLSGCRWVGNMIIQPKRAELDKYFDEVSTIGMQQGDVCIWRNPNNEEDCHIAIFDHYNPDDGNCYYFSQNPGPSRVQVVNKNGHHAFRRKKQKEELAQPVARDEYLNQIEVKVDDLRIRDCGGLACNILGKAKKGFYNYYEVADNNGYKWYRITNDWRRQWIASNDEWTKVYPKKEEFLSGQTIKVKGNYKIVDTKDGMACVFMSSHEVWLPYENIEKV